MNEFKNGLFRIAMSNSVWMARRAVWTPLRLPLAQSVHPVTLVHLRRDFNVWSIYCHFIIKQHKINQLDSYTECDDYSVFASLGQYLASGHLLTSAVVSFLETPYYPQILIRISQFSHKCFKNECFTSHQKRWLCFQECKLSFIEIPG